MSSPSSRTCPSMDHLGGQIDEAVQDPQEGAFPAVGRPHNPGDFLLKNREIDPLQGGDLVISHGKVIYFNFRRHTGQSSSSDQFRRESLRIFFHEIAHHQIGADIDDQDDNDQEWPQCRRPWAWISLPGPGYKNGRPWFGRIQRWMLGNRREDPAVKMITAVSPMERAMLKTIPVTIPGRALGRTMRVMVCHFPRPREKLTSRYS